MIFVGIGKLLMFRVANLCTFYMHIYLHTYVSFANLQVVDNFKTPSPTTCYFCFVRKHDGDEFAFMCVTEKPLKMCKTLNSRYDVHNTQKKMRFKITLRTRIGMYIQSHLQ